MNNNSDNIKFINKRSKNLLFLGISILIIAVLFLLFSYKDNQVVQNLTLTVGESYNIKNQYNDRFSTLEINCSDDSVVEIDKTTGNLYAKKNGEVTITIKLKDSQKVLGKYSIVVKEKDINWIKFDKTSYTCMVGEVIDTMIRTGGNASIKQFNSSDIDLAVIENGTSDGNYTNCIDCRAVHITCKKEGTVTLNATSSTGATTEVSLVINK